MAQWEIQRNIENAILQQVQKYNAGYMYSDLVNNVTINDCTYNSVLGYSQKIINKNKTERNFTFQRSIANTNWEYLIFEVSIYQIIKNGITSHKYNKVTIY